MKDQQQKIVRCPASLILGIFLAALVACGSPARQELTFEALMNGDRTTNEPLPNDTFLSSTDAGLPQHPFEGTLVVSSAEMQTLPEVFETRQIFDRDTKRFPDVALTFFTYEDHLVPVNRDLIRSGSLKTGGSFWDLLVFPGRVWSEPGDHGWTRASFGFALANAMENDTHNGVATFLYNDDEVSDLRYQITTQTTPYYVTDWFVAWGNLEAQLQKTPIDAVDILRESYRQEVDNRFPTKSWSELEALVGPEALEGFDGLSQPDTVIARGLVYDGTLYRSECRTAYGSLPYCENTRFGIWSVTKTAGAALAMLRLAEKYGRQVFDHRLLDHLDADPPHDGWDEVTFGDALNMATGIGGGSETVEPNNPSDGYLVRYEAWYDVASAREKINAILADSNHSWGPGEVFRYRDQDLFLLGAAMDGFLKSREGPNADLWDFVVNEIYEPIGIRQAPINKTLEPDGSDGVPLIAGGYYPTLEDLARIATLIQQGGAHGGKQILHRELLAEMMYQTPVRGLPFGTQGKAGHSTYHMAVWHQPFVAAPDCRVELSYMSGWGGHTVLMLPNGLIGIHIARAEADDSSAGDPAGMAAVAHRLRPLCN